MKSRLCWSFRESWKVSQRFKKTANWAWSSLYSGITLLKSARVKSAILNASGKTKEVENSLSSWAAIIRSWEMSSKLNFLKTGFSSGVCLCSDFARLMGGSVSVGIEVAGITGIVLLRNTLESRWPRSAKWPNLFTYLVLTFSFLFYLWRRLWN